MPRSDALEELERAGLLPPARISDQVLAAHESGSRAASSRRSGVEDEPPGAQCSPGILLSDVEIEPVEWLWPRRIPRAKITILEGDPDVGKSCIAFDIAARVSTGAPMPGEIVGCEPAGVVILSAEDGLADTIRPRLEAVGADLTRIVGLRLEELPTIPESLGTIAEAIKRVDARLVIWDPVVAFLSGAIDAHKDHHVRRALTPLAALAERTGAAQLALRHLTKGGGTNAKYRGGGSIGITAAARSVMLAAVDPTDANRRVLARVKGNLAAPWDSMSYMLVVASNSVKIEWLGATTHTAAELLAQPIDNGTHSALDEAKAFLLDELAGGARPVDEIKKTARSAGISEATLQRAKDALGIRSAKAGGLNGKWLWKRPAPSAADGGKGDQHLDGEQVECLANLDHLTEEANEEAQPQVDPSAKGNQDAQETQGEHAGDGDHLASGDREDWI